MTLPIGHLLVQMGVITEPQRAEILGAQRRTSRPFGQLAEEMFGVHPDAVERAWSEQYASMARWVDPRIEPIDPAAAAVIDRRRAWQFRILPLRYDGDELMVCTTRQHLVRAINFAYRSIPETCYFVLAEPDALGEALMRHHPMDGMSREMIAMDRIPVPMRETESAPP